MVSTPPMRDEDTVIRVVALEDDLINKLIDLVTDYRDEVEGGGISVDQPRSDELCDLDVILAALRNTEAPAKKTHAISKTGYMSQPSEGYYVDCRCGRTGALKPTKEDARADYDKHTTE